MKGRDKVLLIVMRERKGVESRGIVGHTLLMGIYTRNVIFFDSFFLGGRRGSILFPSLATALFVVLERRWSVMTDTSEH